nr:hypothetical protein [Tanacetum cinerariifolium]
MVASVAVLEREVRCQGYRMDEETNSLIDPLTTYNQGKPNSSKGWPLAGSRIYECRLLFVGIFHVRLHMLLNSATDGILKISCCLKKLSRYGTKEEKTWISTSPGSALLLTD